MVQAAGPTVAAWRRGAAELGRGLGPLAGWRAGRRPVVLPPQRLRPALDLDLDLVVLGPWSWWLRRCSARRRLLEAVRMRCCRGLTLDAGAAPELGRRSCWAARWC
ncbi:hypothetical protein ZWY2020_005318 [Hordeum vulgare]|nr:hypothetical protein ZWY2020_005318 [Hordeum vulgare]